MLNPVVKSFDRLLNKVVSPSNAELVEALRERENSWNKILQACQNLPLGAVIVEDHCMFSGPMAMGYAIYPFDYYRSILCLSAEGCSTTNLGERFYIRPNRKASHLQQFVDPDTGWLSSDLVKAFYTSHLSTLLEVNEEQPFDCQSPLLKTPVERTSCLLEIGFWVAEDKGFYLVPDKQGHWQSYQPHLEKLSIAKMQALHHGNYLHMVRLLRYWNRNKSMPIISGKLANTLVYQYCTEKQVQLNDFLDVEFPHLLDFICEKMDAPVYDFLTSSKDLNSLTRVQIKALKAEAFADRMIAESARKLEQSGNYAKSISMWRKLFPDLGG